LGSELVEKTLNMLNVGPMGVLIIMQLSYFFLGMILDDTAILFICLPIYIPIAIHLGFSPLWFGILYIINMQMAYLTPPFGYCLFLIKSVVPKDINYGGYLSLCLAFRDNSGDSSGVLHCLPRDSALVS